MGKVLVLGHDSRAFLSVVRSLGRGGLEVHAAWHNSDSVALKSRYLRRAHVLPPYDETDHSWKPALIELMRRMRFDLIIPCPDPAVVALQRHRRELEPHGRLYVLNERAFDVLSDKVKTNELARSAGVRLPREVLVTSIGQAAPLVAQFGLPIVLKPRSSYNPDAPNSRLVVRKAYTEAAFRGLLEGMLRAGPVAVQENFIGSGVGVELLLKNGEPLLTFQHLRVHEPLHGGGSSYRKAVPLSPELLEASLALLRPLSYTGVAMVEFKVSPDSGDWVFMEVNARFWGSLPLALAAGVDFPLALYRLLVEGRDSFPQQYRPNVYCRNLFIDLSWQRANLKADRTDPTLATRPIPRVIWDALVNVATLREHLDTLTLDDPRPGLTELRQVAGRVGTTIHRAVAQRCLPVPVVRRRLARRAADAVRRADRVLFVCKGNICRSPFAEHLARKRGLFGHVASSGYYPVAGRPSPDKAVDAAGAFGVDLRAHRSRRLTEPQVSEADLILVFDYDNYRQVLAECPFARGLVHYAGALETSGPLFIDDPWGGGPERFERTFLQIERVIAAIVELRVTAPPAVPAGQ